ncbi:hypothetical protein TNCV_4834471 [Trichonephila clavipes]|nr:hypothetical protein TNCV_4834471 [Trichonephila clavipes]
MVDIDILMEIWRNRVKKIDFVLKWLSRVGSEVGPTKGPEQSREMDLLGEGVVTSSMGVNSHLPIHNRFYGFTSWRREETRKRKQRGGDPKGEVEEKSSEKTRAGFLGSGEENPRVLFRDADQESKTRMRNNALRTGPRQAVERAVSKRGYHTGYRHGNY